MLAISGNSACKGLSIVEPSAAMGSSMNFGKWMTLMVS